MDAPDAPNYVGMEVGISRGEEGKNKRGSVKWRLLDENGRPMGNAHSNPLVDSRRYEVKFEDGSKEIFSANTLAENILSQVDENGRRQMLMEEINGHRKLPDAVSKSDGHIMMDNGIQRPCQTLQGWEFLVIWKDGSSNYFEGYEGCIPGRNCNIRQSKST